MVHERIRLSRLLIPLMALMMLTSCGQRQQPTLLTNASGSPEEACQRVLDALTTSDAEAMHGLRITRYEHDSVLVPNMPIGQADPGTTDLADAWFLLEQNNVKGVRRAVTEYGGSSFRVVNVRFTKPSQQHGPVTLHKGTEVTVKDDTGVEQVLPIFGSIIEHGGRFKVVSIRD